MNAHAAPPVRNRRRLGITPVILQEHDLAKVGVGVRIPSPAPVISSMKLIGCDASQVTNKAPDSLSGGTLGGTKAVPRSLKRYSNKPSPTVLTTSPGRLYEADQPGPKRAKQVTRQQGHGPTGRPVASRHRHCPSSRAIVRVTFRGRDLFEQSSERSKPCLPKTRLQSS